MRQEGRLRAIARRLDLDVLRGPVKLERLYIVSGTVTFDGNVPDSYREILTAVRDQPLAFVRHDGQLSR